MILAYRHGGWEHRCIVSVFTVEDYDLVHAGESWCTFLKFPKSLRNQNTITFQPYPCLPGRLQNPGTTPVRGYSQDGTTMTVTVALSAEQSISVVNKSPCVPCLESALFSLGLGPPWPITVLRSPRKY